MITPETWARYSAMRVPRYTSYPTAPNFSPGVGEDQYRQWLAALPPDSPVSLYLHVPFCRAMCWYCGCHTSVTRRRAPIERYVEALQAEIARVGEALGRKPLVRHLHWGGGSPTLLSPGDLAAIDSDLRERFDFAEDGEHAIEIDPRTLTADFAEALGRAGINRASLGVQSFDPTVQAAINRVQSAEQTAAAVDMLRSNGVHAINFDLVYGLPQQTVESCVATVEQALVMRPDRLAVFGYAHVPSFKPHQRKIDEAALPGSEERHRQATAIRDALVGAGYRQIGLDHFALPGDSLTLAAEAGALHRNFQGYTTDTCDVLIGLGPSAIGKLPQGFVQNETRIPEYERRVLAGQLPVVRGCAVSADDRRRAAIIERLMCDYRADVGSFLSVGLAHLEHDGLIRVEGCTVEVVEEARPLIRTVAAAFDAYLPQSETRHVTAV